MTPAQEAGANAEGGAKPGVIHTLPIANGATAIIVHFPKGCYLENPEQGGGNENTTTGGPNDPAGKSTGDKFSEGTLRLHIPAATLEKIWDGTPMTWGQVLTGEKDGKVHMHNEGKDAPTDPLETEEGIAECRNVPVRRIVRFDGSGTTYNFKAYLGLLPGEKPSGVWTKPPVAGTNTNWPLTTSSTGIPSAVPTANEPIKKEVASECNKAASTAKGGTEGICTGSANGGPSLAAAVVATDGSIGYVDLATARENGFTVTPNAKAETEPEKDDLTYWVPLQTVDPEELFVEGRIGKNYVEPTQEPKSNIHNGGEARGSNCTNADYRGIPAEPASDPTLGNWSEAIATGSLDEHTYPNCALTYDFVFDDDATAYGNTPAEEAKARTVKDYFTTATSEAGQVVLSGIDYGRLSGSILKIAQAGVNAIGWNKAAGAEGGKEEGKKEEVKKEEKVTGPPIVTPPSNAFSIAGAKIKGKAIVLSLVLPDAGKVQIKATGGGVTVASVSANVSGGNGTVTLAISKAALKKLSKIKGHKFSVKITVTFTPTGGTAASKVKSLTLTQAALAGKGTKKPKKKGKKG